MRYFKAKKVTDEFTTHSFAVVNDADKIYRYAEIDGWEYLGVDSADIDTLLAAQTVEVSELTFEEIQPIIEDCKMMRDLNAIIETEIAKKYTIGKELKMKELPDDDPRRIEYEEYKERIKIKIREAKRVCGLIT